MVVLIKTEEKVNRKPLLTYFFCFYLGAGKGNTKSGILYRHSFSAKE
jgi:hypothetical protein